MTPLTVSCPRRILETFKRVAKASYPREEYAVLFGQIDIDTVRIKDIWFPEDRARYSNRHSTDHVFSRPQWLDEALAIADSDGLLIVADLHSHPRRESREPSEDDWDTTPEGWLHGVCTVSRGGKRASIRFWPSIRTVVLKTT